MAKKRQPDRDWLLGSSKAAKAERRRVLRELRRRDRAKPRSPGGFFLEVADGRR